MREVVEGSSTSCAVLLLWGMSGVMRPEEFMILRVAEDVLGEGRI